MLPFGLASVALGAAQALCVALPAAGLPGWLAWARGRGWALVAPLSIAVVIGAIAVLPSSADVLTWVALFGVPLGCALALGWAAHGALPPLAALAPVAAGVVWIWPHELGGELARIALIAGSVVTIGRLLAGGAPLVLLKAGLVAMAVIDAILVFGNQLQQPNAVLVAASPGAGLPQLQAATLHGASLGYGDFFAAAVFGAVLAAEGRRQVPAALALLVGGPGLGPAVLGRRHAAGDRAGRRRAAGAGGQSRRQGPLLPPVFSSSATREGHAPLQPLDHVVDRQRRDAAAVIASISTPVRAVVAPRRGSSTVPASGSTRVDRDSVSASGWHSGISSSVRLAAWMPAIRAVPSTSPFGASPAATAAAVSGVMGTTACATARRG